LFKGNVCLSDTCLSSLQSVHRHARQLFPASEILSKGLSYFQTVSP
jgi:hypothetical protein